MIIDALKPIIAILVVGALAWRAMELGIDGTILLASLSTIMGIGGWFASNAWHKAKVLEQIAKLNNHKAKKQDS